MGCKNAKCNDLVRVWFYVINGDTLSSFCAEEVNVGNWLLSLIFLTRFSFKQCFIFLMFLKKKVKVLCKFLKEVLVYVCMHEILHCHMYNFVIYAAKFYHSDYCSVDKCDRCSEILTAKVSEHTAVTYM